jgi:hypothetical protein
MLDIGIANSYAFYARGNMALIKEALAHRTYPDYSNLYFVPFPVTQASSPENMGSYDGIDDYSYIFITGFLPANVIIV